MILSQILVRISSLVKAIHQKFLTKARHSSAFPVVSPVEPLLGFSFWIFLLITSALLTGCGSSRHIQSIPIETQKEITRTDTIYINNVQYDSIYVSQDKFIDRTKDTILIRQYDVEYRYKLLHDTIYRTKIEIVRDSIPYEVRIIETKEVPYKGHWLDWMSDISFVILIILTGWRVYRLFR